MNASEWASLLNGREYGSEMTREEKRKAKSDGVLIFYGYSDDNVEIRGVADEEVSAYDGTTIKLLSNGSVMEDHDCDCEYCGYKKVASVAVHADWCQIDGYSWTFRTDVPHSTFDIMEDGEKFCRGIVLDVASIGSAIEKEQA